MGEQMLSVSLVVTCFNYGRFLPDAIKSARAQNTPFSEIILIDDASTDETPEVMSSLCAQSPALIKVVRHDSNRGQLAAFHSGLAIATGSIICFLDADDVFHSDYVAQIVACYHANPACTFAFCREKRFREKRELENFLATVPGTNRYVDHGLSVLRAINHKHWIGNVTSCLSIRRDLADRFFPLKFEQDWKTRADDCLIWGASLAGGRKFEIKDALVGYRQHETNASLSLEKRMTDPCEVYLYNLASNRLFNLLQAKLGLGPGSAWHAQLEFLTVKTATKYRLKVYAGIAFRAGGFSVSTARAVFHMVKHFLRAQLLSG